MVGVGGVGGGGRRMAGRFFSFSGSWGWFSIISCLCCLPSPRDFAAVFFPLSKVGVRFALDPEGDRLLFLEGMREYASKVTPRQKKVLGKAFDDEVRRWR